MAVRLLYIDGCPHWREADRRLHQALRDVGITTPVEHVTVSSSQDAERLCFRGSPTVLVEGVDPFADPSAPVGLSCRLYQTPEGLRGSPTVEQLVQVLTNGAALRPRGAWKPDQDRQQRDL